MKEGEMIRALGEIRDEYITEALPEKTAPRRKKKVFRWIAAAAACLLLGLYLCVFAIPEAACITTEGITLAGRKDISDRLDRYREELEENS